MKRIVFRVDSSVKIGIGHMMRCMSLADDFKKKGHNITFICKDLQGNSYDIVRRKYEVFTILCNKKFQSDSLYSNWLGSTQEEDAKSTLNILPRKVDYLIVDNYALDERWHKRLKPYVNKIIVIDDLADRNFDCNVLLNQNLGINKNDYLNIVPGNCELLLGCQYALLRSEFSKLREKAIEKRRHTKVISNILISMGGIDADNLTYSILQKVGDDINTVVVLGGESPHNKMIIKYAKGKNIKIIVDADNMATLMLNADLAIGAGGSSSWERCCLGLPTLLFVMAENQKIVASNLERAGAVKIVNDLENDLENDLDLIFSDYNLWESMSEKSQAICDGLGTTRVLND